MHVSEYNSNNSYSTFTIIVCLMYVYNILYYTVNLYKFPQLFNNLTAV